MKEIEEACALWNQHRIGEGWVGLDRGWQPEHKPGVGWYLVAANGCVVSARVARAVAEKLAAPPLVWSSDPPKVPGDYKIRYASMKHVTCFQHISAKCIAEEPPEFWEGQQFAGPYPQPAEPEGGE